MPHCLVTQPHWGTTSNTLFLGGKGFLKITCGSGWQTRPSGALCTAHTHTSAVGIYSYPWCCSQVNEPMTYLSTLNSSKRDKVHKVLSVPVSFSDKQNFFVLFLFWKVQKSGKLWFKTQPFGSLERQFPDRALQLLALSDPLGSLSLSSQLAMALIQKLCCYTNEKAVLVLFVWVLLVLRQGLSIHPWLAWNYLCSPDGLKLVAILLPLTLECQDYRCVHMRTGDKHRQGLECHLTIKGTAVPDYTTVYQDTK